MIIHPEWRMVIVREVLEKIEFEGLVMNVNSRINLQIYLD